MTRRRLSVALVVLVLVGTPWANAEAQTRSLKPLTAAELEPVAANQGNAGAQYCPEGTWPRDLHAGRGGGLSTLRGGGLSTLRGGGLSTLKGGGLSTLRGGGLSTLKGGGLSRLRGGGLSRLSGPYCSNIPPWDVFLEYLENNGYDSEARVIRAARGY